MKFSIITPSYNRPNKLIRCVESVIHQNEYKFKSLDKNKCPDFDFELIIINDSPFFDYSIFNNYLNKLKVENFENFSKIKYFVNTKNMGVNYSRNLALDYVSKDAISNYVIFLDDDDWLHDNALKSINNILKEENKNINWLVTNRSVGNISLTKNKTNKSIINYFWDYLILKRFTGDVTHVIQSKIATQFRFSTKIKNGEEWYYFVQFPYKFLYKNVDITNSKGYEVSGLNIGMQKSYIENTKIFRRDLSILIKPKILLVSVLRQLKIIVNIFIKK